MQDLKKALPDISRLDNSLKFELHANTTIFDGKKNLPYMWYIYYPDGGHDRYSFYFVNTR